MSAPVTPNPHNLPPENLYHLMTVDFRDMWDALANNATAQGRGNFPFARSAMGILEFASRLCSSDSSGKALTDFGEELQRIEPRYFTALPGPTASPGMFRGVQEWSLPHNGGSGPEGQLLWALFDVVRHGQAHQGQQCMVALNDGSTFGVSIYGAEVGRTMDAARTRRWESKHLSMERRDDLQVIWLFFRPDVFFLDLDDAIFAARLLDRGLTFPYLERPVRPGSFDFSLDELSEALTAGGHMPWTPLGARTTPL